MIDLSKLGLTQVAPWTPEEELAEAKAWGYDSVEDWLEDMDKAMDEAKELNYNMQHYGTIDKPEG